MRKLLVVLGVPVDNLTMEEALDRCDEFIAIGRATGRTHQIATVNADFVVNSLHDPELQRILQEADMATADGMPLVWGSRLLGGPLSGRVTGADMVPALARRAAQKGYSIFFLGAREGIAAKAADMLQQRNPGMRIAGVLSPPPRSILEMDQSVVDAVKAAQPDILLVAFGNPKQEKWIRMYAHELHVPICIGVGGTFDMIVGVTKRAPTWMQKVGLEWAYRLSQEPQRLAKRYLHDFGYFGYFFVRQWWGMRRGTAISMVPPKPVPEVVPPALPVPPLIPVEAPLAPIAPSLLPPTPPDPLSHTPTPMMTLQGRLDIDNQDAFADEANRLLDVSPYLILNLAEATFLDSSALGVLVALANRAHRAGGALWLVAIPPQIQSLFRLVRLDTFFEVYPDADTVEFKRRQEPQPVAPQPTDNGWSIVRMPRMYDGNNIATITDRCLEGIETNPYLVLDFSDTVFMSSAGMASLLRLDRAARSKSGALRVVSCSNDLVRTLKLINIDTILTLMADVATATREPVQSAPNLTDLRVIPSGTQ
ncbi:WecB/TagA/CpsF family glycosyltransferase [Candidatus Oscillochloris fontis]|uniref:WecB/TagA/CpsF family glycosyltransferase n=1 Tax=Candidatus Oscillochloris fontis TaxID=2496868 RepID=UPI0015837A9C|nr:WecB/TagA/CpsF family glycosyltransferase [Candidatus Oscillochloris fontis]